MLPLLSSDIDEHPRPLLHDDRFVGHSIIDMLSLHEVSRECDDDMPDLPDHSI